MLTRNPSRGPFIGRPKTRIDFSTESEVARASVCHGAPFDAGARIEAIESTTAGAASLRPLLIRSMARSPFGRAWRVQAPPRLVRGVKVGAAVHGTAPCGDHRLCARRRHPVAVRAVRHGGRQGANAVDDVLAPWRPPRLRRSSRRRATAMAITGSRRGRRSREALPPDDATHASAGHAHPAPVRRAVGPRCRTAGAPGAGDGVGNSLS